MVRDIFFTPSAEGLFKAVVELALATPYPDLLMALQILTLPNLQSRLEAAIQVKKIEIALIKQIHTYCYFFGQKTFSAVNQLAINLCTEAIELGVVHGSVAISGQFNKTEIKAALVCRKEEAEKLLPLANSG